MQESVIYRSIQEEAETRAKARQRREIAFNLLQGGVDINLIASSTGLAIEEVQQLQEQIDNPSQN
jgi:predicted transposase YdaD